MTVTSQTLPYTHGSGHLTGVLLSNLGTPDAPTPAALRRYLKQFLSDPRVVEYPRWLWLPILYGVILNIRPRRSAHAYATIWNDQGSPLLAISQRQARALQQRLSQEYGAAIRVELGMRYGQPSVASALRALQQAGASRIVVLPLYPQYSSSTTASTFDAIGEELRSWRRVPELHWINHYHDHPAYIAALVATVRRHWQQHGQAERLMFSFHGTPQRMFDSGDPYFCHCHKTARRVAEQLSLPEGRWQLCFQSRFGREAWLQPYTDQTLQAWARQGIASVQVISPGFSADCLETLEEVALQNRALFLAAGGQQYQYIPALNDDDEHVAMMQALVQPVLQAWGVSRDDASGDPSSRARALAMGAGG
ncbi:MAG: ferrochelatase [Gammaproteobacteria bacterium]|nr:ferrochelatase [Gammaproteobacteria bacterium]